MKIDLLKIKSSFLPPKGHKLGFDEYVASIERLVKKIVPESIFEIEEASHFIPTEACFQKLHEALPLLRMSESDEAPCTLSISMLCQADYSHGVGRFLADRIARDLLPGKSLPLTLLRSLSFKFLIQPNQRYFITETCIEVENTRDLKIIQDNFSKLSHELCLTTAGVEHARKIVLAKALSIEEKGMILLENLTSLIKGPQKELYQTLFDETHILLLKAIQEKTPDKIPDHLIPLIEAKPQVFDFTIFNEIQNYLMVLDASFSKTRPISHLNKLLSYIYLFRKIITHTIITQPQNRHISFKLLKTQLKEKEQTIPILSFLIGVNLLNDHEILTEQEVFRMIEQELPSVQLVKESLITQKQKKERIRTLYLEIQKENALPFSQEEVKLLKKKIPKKIKSCIHKIPAPQPSHYSEEETMRNILTLSKELKSPHSSAQMIIQFHNQSNSDLNFSVILGRIQKSNTPPPVFPNTPQLTIGRWERKVCGILNKRYIKEAYVFDVKIKDTQEIAEGRRLLVRFLKEHLPEIRDFNGGMITRQYETLAAFKKLLKDPMHESLVENYFYSITPSYMQSLIPPHILKEHFFLLSQIIDSEGFSKEHTLISKTHEDYALFMVCTTESSLVDSLKDVAYSFIGNSNDLFSTYLKVFDLHALGFLIPNKEIEADFRVYLEGVLQEHKTKECFQLTL